MRIAYVSQKLTRLWGCQLYKITQMKNGKRSLLEDSINTIDARQINPYNLVYGVPQAERVHERGRDGGRVNRSKAFQNVSQATTFRIQNKLADCQKQHQGMGFRLANLWGMRSSALTEKLQEAILQEHFEVTLLLPPSASRQQKEGRESLLQLCKLQEAARKGELVHAQSQSLSSGYA